VQPKPLELVLCMLCRKNWVPTLECIWVSGLSGLAPAWRPTRGQPSAVMPRPRRAETSVLANALKKDGFTIISMCPGWVQTDMGQRAADEVRPPATTRRAACCLPSDSVTCVHAGFDERLWTVTLTFADSMISFVGHSVRKECAHAVRSQRL